MSKSQFNNTLFNVPTSQMILGTMREGKPTCMALGWVTCRTRQGRLRR